MKWVKVAIGAVIAIMSISIIATSVYDMTQNKVKVVETTIIGATEGYYADPDVYDIVVGLYNNSNSVQIFIDDVYFIDDIVIEEGYFTIVGAIETWGSDNIITDLQGNVDDSSTIRFEFELPPLLTGITATLLLLAPVIFVSGVLYFIYNNKQEGI